MQTQQTILRFECIDLAPAAAAAASGTVPLSCSAKGQWKLTNGHLVQGPENTKYTESEKEMEEFWGCGGVEIFFKGTVGQEESKEAF